MLLPSIIFEWKVRKAKEDPFASCLLENRLHSDVRELEPKTGGKNSDFVIGWVISLTDTEGSNSTFGEQTVILFWTLCF